MPRKNSKTVDKRTPMKRTKKDNTAVAAANLVKKAYLGQAFDVDKFGRELHAFASEAYYAALDYYGDHYRDPAALAAFTRALKGKKERAR